MSKSEKIELNLYRSGMLRSNFNAYHLEKACKSVARHVARLDRWRLAACNGIPRYDAKAKMVLASWTEEDQEKADKQTDESRKAIQDDLRAFFKPGAKYKFYTDPRAGVVLRISDKANAKDVFI